MKRAFATALFAAVFALALSTSVARAGSVGIGAFGGMSIPIVQDDNGSGPVFGIRVPVALIPLLTVEPYFGSTSGGEAEEDIGGTTYTREGFDITSFGANAMLTMGGPIQFYPFIGIGSHSLKRTGVEDRSEIGFGGGFGVGFSPVPKLWAHIRAEASSINVGSGSRTFVNATAGVSYSVFSFPAP